MSGDTLFDTYDNVNNTFLKGAVNNSHFSSFAIRARGGNDICAQCPSKLMFEKDSGITRGHSEKLQTQRATGYRHHFFSIRVVKIWNSLSDDTIQARTVNELK